MNAYYIKYVKATRLEGIYLTIQLHIIFHSDVNKES